ncbi:DUF2075 domain-containing protein [Paenisporosarcina cavernae]|uniref:DUF2075 domain-containing protein n=2 Tax=Paenisporosarcina cavernae TaxID=2320858 RepID=A0A385YWL1_9BACL|nr:DUF2075 domain-containing protein [Paenisporosarcina cavernae]
MDQINLIKHEQFNRSATFHLETKLINYFLGDEKYTLQNKSKTSSDFTHNYYNKSYYDHDIFRQIWTKLMKNNLVDHPLHVIENKDIFKLSPFKELTLEQVELKEKVLEFCEEQVRNDAQAYGSLLVIEGEAGVGKSVVLSSIFNTIQERAEEASSPLYKTENYLVVNHEEMFKTYKDIAKQVKHLKAKNFAKPTPLINKLQQENKQVDIIFVDEAHLLLTKSDTYNNFHANNHLEELLKLARVVVIIFDQDQVLKLKSLWDGNSLDTLKKKSTYWEEYQLTNQFRMQANEEVINWVNAFKQKKLWPLPTDNNYEVKIFKTLQELSVAIKKRDEVVGLSRVVSTFDYLHKKDGETYYVKESNGDYQIPWNTTSPKYTWAENPDTVHEAGSIYTIQGFDLNYVGVVLGPSVKYDETRDEIVIDTDLYMDKGAYSGMNGIENVAEGKEKIVLNSINILMKRGINGLYIYAYDDALRKKLLEYQLVQQKE